MKLSFDRCTLGISLASLVGLTGVILTAVANQAVPRQRVQVYESKLWVTNRIADLDVSRTRQGLTLYRQDGKCFLQIPHRSTLAKVCGDSPEFDALKSYRLTVSYEEAPDLLITSPDLPWYSVRVKDALGQPPKD